MGTTDGEATPWWRSFFDADYAAYGLDAFPAERNEAMADAVVDLLRLSPRDLVFDQCSGVGRLSIPLARRGLRVLGVDLSEEYVETARARAREAGVDCVFEVGDAATFTTPEACDGALNWFSSFAYFETPARDRRMLESAFASLRPGGRFVLEFLHMASLLRRFEPYSVDRRAWEGDELIAFQERRLDLDGGRIDADWTFVYPDGRRSTRHTSMRLYMAHELAEMLRDVGFVDVELLDSRDREPLRLDSRRVLVLGRRP